MYCLTLAALLSVLTAAPLFQSGGTIDSFNLLDYHGDARAEQVALEDCPPGYGPAVLRLSGTVVVLLAKGGHGQEGTYVALYRERSAATLDADGVILVGGAFGDDLGLEHNTKTMRPHVWLEQDNDTGLSFREASQDGSDRAIAEAVAAGLVTDSWNETGWIWQKVQVGGGMIRAKFWPAPFPEPEEWALEIEATLPGDRYGIRINSGEIDLAWFAASPDDISIAAPRAYVHLPRAAVDEGEAIPITLFTVRDAASTIPLTCTVSGEDGHPIALATVDAPLPAGNGTVYLTLSAGGTPTPLNTIPVPITTPLPRGLFTVTLESGEELQPISRAFQVEAESDVLATIRARGVFLNTLKGAAAADTAAMEIAEVARGLLGYSQSLYDAGERDEARSTLRFVDETLAGLHGVAGSALRATPPSLDLSGVPAEYEATTGAGGPESDKTDYYRPNSRLRSGVAECNAASFVMGRSYAVRIPFEVLGEAPAGDFSILVTLRDPLGNRTVAEARIKPDPPTSQWQPGNTYWQSVALAIPRDDARKQVPQPVVLDEVHDLLVGVYDEASGAAVLLENEPGRQPDRVGHSYAVGRIFVSSTPLQIDDLYVVSEAGGRDVITASVRNHDTTRRCTAEVRLRAPSGKVVHEQHFGLEVPEGGNVSLRSPIDQHHVGVTAEVQLWDGNALLAEARRDGNQNPAITFVRENHVETGKQGFVTPIRVVPGRWTAPIDVIIEAGGATLATATGITGETTLEPLPHFGYYDVTATSGNTVWHQRLVATVVETRDDRLLVNGEPFLVKGVNVHAMDASSPARTRLMMRILKGLGFNSLRGDYPPRWQVDMAEEEGLTYDILAPFSVASTGEIFGRQDGPPLGTARALTRQFIARYADAAGALLWNSCNEITGENIAFLLAQYPLYRLYDPYQRPVHYANLYGQDLWQGQDVMGVNYYFSDTQRAVDRQPLIARSASIAEGRGLPMIFTEYNSYHGAIPTTGVEAMEGLFRWGVEQGGMAGGYLYMMPDSDRHPGVFDNGYNTHRIMNEAFHRAFDDAEVIVAGREGDEAVFIEVRNRRPFTLRRLALDVTVSGVPTENPSLGELAPGKSIAARISVPPDTPGPDYVLEGTLALETHYGLPGHVPVRLTVAE